MLFDLGKGRSVNVVVLALELVDAHKHFLVVDCGDPAKARKELLILLELVKVRIECLFLLQESSVYFQQGNAH